MGLGYQARMDAARTMYHELSPETAEFIDFMQDNELFDVESRPGKMSGGYMTSLPSYKAPFIFANWNDTSGDVDVLTHECGHAFEGYVAERDPNVPADLECPASYENQRRGPKIVAMLPDGMINLPHESPNLIFNDSGIISIQPATLHPHHCLNIAFIYLSIQLPDTLFIDGAHTGNQPSL